MAKPIYLFIDKKDIRTISSLPPDEARGLLGGKGAGLFEMSRLGLRVPPGFTLTTEVCQAYYKRKSRLKLTRAAQPKSERLI